MMHIHRIKQAQPQQPITIERNKGLAGTNLLIVAARNAENSGEARIEQIGRRCDKRNGIAEDMNGFL